MTPADRTPSIFEDLGLREFVDDMHEDLRWNARRARDGRETGTSELEQEQGAACIRHRDGWTALAWWDRSGDRRGGSNTVLVARADLTFAEMINLLGVRFPWMLDRQPAPLDEREPMEVR